MTTARRAGPGVLRRRPGRVTEWAVWSLPCPVLAIVLAVDLLAVASLVADLVIHPGPFPPQWPWVLVVLAVGGIVSTEASIGVERVRRPSDESPYIDLSSVWVFAGAVLLPGPLACVVVAAVYGHIYVRVWRRSGFPAHRVAFTVATVVLAVQVAATVVGGGAEAFTTPAGIGRVLLALLAYATVNVFLVVAVIVLSGPGRDLPALRHVLARGDDAVLELATLSMGVLVAGAIATFGPAYAVLVLPPLIVLHRTVLVPQLEEAARTDGKTGLLTIAAWRVQAAEALRRTERSGGHAGVLVLDIDLFKLVNDRHGHLVGDHVLATVAAVVRAEVRDDDLVGRFGGEEFVVLLAGLDHAEGHPSEVVAERIRRRIEELRVEVAVAAGPAVVDDLTVSIGGATFPADGRELTRLVEVADAAMYAAKHAGRNTVRIGLPTLPDAGTPPARP